VRSRILSLALFAATLGFVAHRALAPMGETDLFFHLKLGELILERHAIPFRNLFSFTHPDAPDLDLSWAFQVTVALLHRAGGFAAIVLMKVALVVAAAALVHRACRRSGAGPAASAAAVALAIATSGQRLVERPHLVTFVGLGALALALAELDAGRRRVLALVPPLVVVWANFHAGVFLAPLTLALWGAGARLDGQRPGRAFWLVTALSAAATFATPAGTMLPNYLLWHTGLGATRIIEEFRHADLYDDPWLFTQGALALVSAVAIRQWRRILPVVIVFALACRSVRFAAEWGLLAAPLCALGLTALGRVLRVSADGLSPAALVAGGAEPSQGSALIHMRQFAAPAVAAALVVLVAVEHQPVALGLDPDVVPFAAIDFVTRSGLRDRLYEDLDVGCYLLWEGWPRWRVFQDARLPAYPDAFHRALDETPLAPAAFDALLRRYGVDAALLSDPDTNMRAGSFDPEEWALVYKADDALVLARRTEAHAALIAAREIPLRPRFAFASGTRFEPVPTPPARSPVRRCEWDRRLARALDADGRVELSVLARARAFERGCLDADELRNAYGWNLSVGR
jgi:hypothetical protein